MTDDERRNLDMEINNRGVKLSGSRSKGAERADVRTRSDRSSRQRRRRMSPRCRRLIPSSGKHCQRHFSRPIAFPLGRSIKTHRRRWERSRGALFLGAVARSSPFSREKWHGLAIHSRNRNDSFMREINESRRRMSEFSRRKKLWRKTVLERRASEQSRRIMSWIKMSRRWLTKMLCGKNMLL